MKRDVIAAGINASVEFPCSQIEGKTPTLDKRHLKGLPNEFPRESDAGRTSTDDADLGSDHKAVWEGTTVNVHCWCQGEDGSEPDLYPNCWRSLENLEFLNVFAKATSKELLDFQKPYGRFEQDLGNDKGVTHPTS